MKKFHFIFLLLFYGLLVSQMITPSTKPNSPGQDEISPPMSEWINSNRGFELNLGQVVDFDGNKVNNVLFSVKEEGFSLFFTNEGVSYVIYQREDGRSQHSFSPDQNPRSMNNLSVDINGEDKLKYSRIDLDLLNANINMNNISYEDEMTGYANYYLPQCPEGLVSVKNYKRITVKDVYPGIDWVFKYDENGQLHHEFNINLNANPEQIKFKVKWADVKLSEDGKQMTLSTPLGKITDGKIVSNEGTSEVDVKYKYIDGVVSYDVIDWHRGENLVIDPPLSLLWATYYTGNGYDYGNSVSIDGSGNVIVTGYTNSTNFPVLDPGNGTYYQGTNGGGYMAFIIKFNNSGVRLWATYYGGTGSDYGYGSSIDGSGNIFITGYTTSTDLPTLDPGNGAYYQGTNGGSWDAFILKFNNSGVRQWATYYGGTSGETPNSPNCIATDGSGNVYLTGYTTSTDLPTLDPGSGAYYQGTPASLTDAYIIKFNNAGNRLWATYYGGSSDDQGLSITTDASGNVFITGDTQSNDFPLLDAGNGAYYQGTFGGGVYDAFILKFDSSCVRRWATFYGGSNSEYGLSITTDVSENVFVTGRTFSTNFPTLDAGNGAYYQGTINGSLDAYLLKFNNSGVRLWATYYGGSSFENGNSIATDAAGNIFVMGMTQSSDFPLLDPGGGAYYQGTIGGGWDDAILKFNNSGVRLWATYYGGSGVDNSTSLAADVTGNVFATGYTVSTDFPLLSPGGGAYYQGTGGGTYYSAFILKFEYDEPLPVELTSFTASVNGKTVTLKWQTATEVNNYGFEIERKTVNTNWDKIGFVPGKSNSNSIKKYSFVDSSLVSGNEFGYRLKQIDNDGTFSYSSEAYVELKIDKYSLSANYPNPFNPSTRINYSIPEEELVTLKVYNALGEEIVTIVNEEKPAGNYSVTFDASKLTSGVYVYKMSAGSFIQTRKMLLVK